MPPKNKKDNKKTKSAKDKVKDTEKISVTSEDSGVEVLTEELSELALQCSGRAPSDINRSCSGVLTSHKDSRDIKVELFSMSYFSQVLIQETTIELNFGRRYALIGANGSGKSTFLKALSSGEIPLPSHIDVYLLREEFPASDKTALEATLDVCEQEVKRLEAEMEAVMVEDPESALLDDICSRLDALDPATFETRAASILVGLGFTDKTMKKKTRDLSGGWRMRVSLARALFVRPTLLLLDQPTNHLDLGAVVWLENYLAKYDRILLMICHSQDFMNSVCTNIIHLTPEKKVFQYYTGNFDQMVKTKEELDTNQMKAFNKQQAEIEHMKKFIASVGTYANLVKQAKSRQKIIDKMEAAGLVEEVEKERVWNFRFASGGQLPPPVLSFTDVSFSYSGKKEDYIYENLEIGIDTESRVALVGPNGAGKSTLLKLMMGELVATEGQVGRHTRLKLCKYSQHSSDQLDLDLSAIDYLRKKFPEMPQDLSHWRSQIGRFGLTAKSQLCPINQLSDGQKSRIVFCELSLSNPNIILLDEPTNALDIETIDSLAEALNAFDGGVVLVSHDFRLISQVADQIWVCEDKTVTPWDGTIAEYKSKLQKEVIGKAKYV
ncbi:hypothetical protein SeMB42_g01510 [Synchytrium endobioticum]|uniref:ABC transporter domain-containing protein n=1 Tax=Synchytrium endobioticum TaxID=286115 RepID=A0A507DAQ3_9FUNG|nr:hypothetical protein SeLEV6574_g01985 [Synchytrium endobioticum]TPX52316.1 hypothetical protein SeMB42_g01510 [Synchytrium endobioticum]